MVLASLLFMRCMSEVTNVRAVTRTYGDATDADETELAWRRELPAAVEVYEIDGTFFFGAPEKFKDTLAEVSRKPRVLVIRLRNVPAIDSTAPRRWR